ncbi:MAG: histidine--tRNA ligase [Longimicrobiales bacterium]|nr:histidine--tRNA ligase [Longimicrobiales bacterium]
MSAPDFARLPGFRDFGPEDLVIRSHIFETWRRISTRHAFREYDGPPLESLDLYVEKSGEEIVGQLYNFVDKGGREVSLRPEMTPTLARILGERSRGMPKPIRWFTIPQLFRYERQQRGRLREHFQWNVDIVGEADEAADAEVLAVALDALRAFGLTARDIRARVSDRRLLAALLTELGVKEAEQPGAWAVIDKLEREPRDRSRARLVDEVGIAGEIADRVLALFDAPELADLREAFGGCDRVVPHLERLERYISRLEAMGFADFVEIDLTIVRGLAYYTGIVFEIFDRAGELRAICGGGRYDRLLELVGGEPLPAVGFGMGDVVLGELLDERGLRPDTRHAIDYFIVTIGEETYAEALALAQRLRGAGHAVAYSLRAAAVRKQFKAAENEGAREVIVLGPDELARGVAVVREMAGGGEREVPVDRLGA